jgi:ABC-type glycerol-3-phosphate transport system substrate-binding protein
MSAAGVEIFEEKNGKLQYIEDITALHNYTDAMLKLTGTQGFYLSISGGPNPSYDHTAKFIEGKALFAFDSPVLVMEGTLLQNMDDKAGILPYPKYADEKYGALATDNANVGGILYNSDKFTEMSAYLQMATDESNGGKGTLIYEYFDVTLKYKLSNAPEQVDMLEFIRDGLCCPMTILYDNYFAKSVSMKAVHNHVNASLANGSNVFASGWESQYDAVQSMLEQTLTTYGQQN